MSIASPTCEQDEQSKDGLTELTNKVLVNE